MAGIAQQCVSYARVWPRRGAALLVAVAVVVPALMAPALASSAPTTLTTTTATTTPFVPGGEAQFDGDPALPSSCQYAFTYDVALLCDPSTEMRAPKLTLTGLAYPRYGASLAGPDQPSSPDLPTPPPATGSFIESTDEPMLPGETLTATWSAAGPAPLLVARVADPVRGSRPVVFSLVPDARSATLTVNAAGTVTFTSGGASQTQASPAAAVGDPGVTVPWDAATPADAVSTFIDHLGLSSGADGAWLCAAIEPDLRPLFGDDTSLGEITFPVPLSLWPDALGPGQPCDLLDLVLFGEDDDSDGLTNPLVTGSTGTVTGTRLLSASRAIVTARLTHHYAASADDPGPQGGVITTTATTLVTRGIDGQWHIATPTTLLPLSAYGGKVELSEQQLLANRTQNLAAARSTIDPVRADLTAEHRAAVPVGAHPACAGTRRSTAVDRTAAISVAGDSGESSRSEDPELANVGMSAATLTANTSRLCLSIRFRQSAPQAVILALSLNQRSQEVDEDVVVGPHQAVGNPVVSFDPGDADTYQPIPGLAVARAGRTLSISLPLADLRGLDAAKSLHWGVETDGFDPYGALDEATVPNGSGTGTLP